jgi:hypothetical protein
LTGQNAGMQPDALIAFPASADAEGLDIRVNFGVFAGREATPAELDDLARELVPEVREVSIVAEQRHEIAGDVEAAVHQVRVEIDGARLPEDGAEREELTWRLVAAADRWARSCIADRHAEVAEP